MRGAVVRKAAAGRCRLLSPTDAECTAQASATGAAVVVMGLPFLAIGENMNAQQLPLRRLNASLSVNLPPAAAEDIESGLRVELDALLLKHSYDFGGVVLAYEKEVVLSKRGVIGPYFPYLNLKARALLTVFQPKIGDAIVGTVNQIGNDYVGLLILGVLNASISSAQMGGRFSFKQGDWRASRGPGQSIQVGCEVRFTVQGTHEQGDFFSISGSLAEAGTGPLPPREGAPAAAQAGEEDDDEEIEDANGVNPFSPPSVQPEPTPKLKEKKDKKAKKSKSADVAEENGGMVEKKEKKEKKSKAVHEAEENGGKKEKKAKSADADEEDDEKTQTKKEKKSKAEKKEKKKDKEGGAEEKKKKKVKREAAADDGDDRKASKKAKKQKK